MNNINIEIDKLNRNSYEVALHGNPIISNLCDGLYVSNGNYKLTPTTKRAIVAILGGSFNGSLYSCGTYQVDLSQKGWHRVG